MKRRELMIIIHRTKGGHAIDRESDATVRQEMLALLDLLFSAGRNFQNASGTNQFSYYAGYQYTF